MTSGFTLKNCLLMNRLDFNGAKSYALDRLEQELSPKLTYHSFAHTLKDVVPSTKRLSVLEGVDGEECILLLTAAYFHDIGFVEQTENHEEIGVRMVGEVLPQFDYDRDQIEAIQSLIMATKLPQTPKSLLEEILLDADLDVLGRDDFLERSMELRAERAALGVPSTHVEWYTIQLQFLQTHRFWTKSARRLREKKKQENIGLLIKLIEQAQTAEA